MKLFVAGLPLDMDKRELKAIFSDYGELIAAKIITDRVNGHSRGFGFVEMVEEADALTAIEALDGATIEGKVMTVKRAEYRPRANKSSAPIGSFVTLQKHRLV